MTFSQSLEDYRWKNRLIILVAEANNLKLREQRELFDGLEKELAERDLLILERSLNNMELTKRFKLPIDFQGILLVGKDGGIKLKKDFPVEPKAIFELVDSMPMRKAEMKRNGH